MSIKKFLTYSLLFLILVSGCTLQKRTYREGYYVHWNSSSFTKENISNPSDKQFEIESNETVIQEPLIAENDKSFILTAKQTIIDSIKKMECGDSLWTTNGNASRVKILEVNEKNIIYKRCSNINGPRIIVPKSYVSKLKYSNGVTEINSNFSTLKLQIQESEIELKREAIENKNYWKNASRNMRGTIIFLSILSTLLTPIILFIVLSPMINS